MLGLARIFAASTIVAATALGSLSAQAPRHWTPPSPGEFKGTNYLPSTTQGFGNAMGFLTASGFTFDGAYSSTQVRTEIAQISKAGINNVRIFPSFFGWLARPADYMANLRDFAQICKSRNVSITYVMWSTTATMSVPTYLAVDPNIVPIDPTLDAVLQQLAIEYTLNQAQAPIAAVLSLGEPWQYALLDEPGLDLFGAPYFGVMSTWPNSLEQKCKDYVDAIGDFFANDPDGKAVFGSYDGFNEPDCCGLTNPIMIDIIRMTYNRLATKHAMPGAPKFEFTIGYADYTQTLQNYIWMTNQGVKQTYLSYHCYEVGAQFTQIAMQNASWGQLINKPVVCSEFYDRNKPGHIGAVAQMTSTLSSNGIAGNVWAYLASNLVFPDPTGIPNSYVRFDGLVIPSTIPVQSFTSTVLFMFAPGLAVNDALAINYW